jgi:hypothetical protein
MSLIDLARTVVRGAATVAAPIFLLVVMLLVIMSLQRQDASTHVLNNTCLSDAF